MRHRWRNENPCLGRSDQRPSTTDICMLQKVIIWLAAFSRARLQSQSLMRCHQSIAGGKIAFVAPGIWQAVPRYYQILGATFMRAIPGRRRFCSFLHTFVPSILILIRTACQYGLKRYYFFMNEDVMRHRRNRRTARLSWASGTQDRRRI
jgi:hypothetical protein